MAIAGTRRTNNSRQCDSGGLDRNACCHRLCFHSQLCSCLNDHRAAGQIFSFSKSSGFICVGQVQWPCLQFSIRVFLQVVGSWLAMTMKTVKKACAIQISWHLNLNGSRSPDAHLFKVAKNHLVCDEVHQLIIEMPLIFPGTWTTRVHTWCRSVVLSGLAARNVSNGGEYLGRCMCLRDCWHLGHTLCEESSHTANCGMFWLTKITRKHASSLRDGSIWKS